VRRRFFKGGLAQESAMPASEIIERCANKKVVTERRSALLEQKLFVSAYAIRRLNQL
jgi:hypothetical protein